MYEVNIEVPIVYIDREVAFIEKSLRLPFLPDRGDILIFETFDIKVYERSWKFDKPEYVILSSEAMSLDVKDPIVWLTDLEKKGWHVEKYGVYAHCKG
jgi:hypothetical protein